MPTKTANGATAPVGSDPYNLTGDLKKMAETLSTIIPVENEADRNGLATRYTGNVLPVPTVVSRLDIPGAPLEIWDGIRWNTGRGIAYTPQWLGAEGWGSEAEVEGYYWRNGDQIRVVARIMSKGVGISLGLATIGFTLPPGLPVGKGFMATGGGLHNTSGTAGALRQVITAAGPDQTSATVWIPREQTQMLTPGNAGVPWGVNSAFHVWIEYRTST